MVIAVIIVIPIAGTSVDQKNRTVTLIGDFNIQITGTMPDKKN